MILSYQNIPNGLCPMEDDLPTIDRGVALTVFFPAGKTRLCPFLTTFLLLLDPPFLLLFATTFTLFELPSFLDLFLGLFTTFILFPLFDTPPNVAFLTCAFSSLLFSTLKPIPAPAEYWTAISFPSSLT